ncbi:hypothetical protein GQ472_02540 [archaeon]|nr:hypothetical protein [archaeon]
MNSQDYTIDFESLIGCKVIDFDESANLLVVKKGEDIRKYYLGENEETLFLSSQKIKPCSIKRNLYDSIEYSKISGNNNTYRNSLSFIIGSEILEVKERYLKDQDDNNCYPCGVEILSRKDGRTIMHDLVSLNKGCINIYVSLH